MNERSKNALNALIGILGSAVALCIAIAIIVAAVTQCKPAPPVTWRGIDRDRANCVVDDWHRQTCIDQGRRYLCIREHFEYQCAELPSLTPERSDAR